jgi:hypothetical protein
MGRVVRFTTCKARGRRVAGQQDPSGNDHRPIAIIHVERLVRRNGLPRAAAEQLWDMLVGSDDGSRSVEDVATDHVVEVAAGLITARAVRP